MVEIYALNITTQKTNDKYDHYINFIDCKKRERINQLFFKEDRKRTLYSDILVRLLVMERLKIANSNIGFMYNKYGKPYLVNHPNIHFNVSHSGEWVVCGIGSKELGVDIEIYGENHDDIAKRCYTKYEYNDLIKYSGEERSRYFYQLWTLKESYTKCLGKGLNIPLNSFGFRIFNDKIYLQPNSDTYIFCSSSRLAGYSMSVCSSGERINHHIHKIEL